MAKKPKATPEVSPAAGHGLVPLAPQASTLLHGAVVNAEGQLVDINLVGRTGAWLAGLEERMGSWPKDASCGPRIAFQTDDPAVCFAHAAHERLDGEMCRCEERLPVGARHRVLYVVVRRDPRRWRKALLALGAAYFGPAFGGAAGVRLEIIDKRTEDSLQRLVKSGVLAATVARARSLWPPAAGKALELSPAECGLAAAHRARAARSLKAASLLARGDMAEEARAAALNAVEPLGRALAVENRLPEPESLEDALMPPLDKAWKAALPAVRELLRTDSQPLLPVIAALQQI